MPFPMVINKMLISNFIYALVTIAAFLIYESTRRDIQLAFVSAIDYIMYQPIGVKHNRLLRAVFGRYCRSLVTADLAYTMHSSLRLCTLIVFAAYRYVFSSLTEMIDLLKGRTYNPVIGRYDTISLKTDQIALTVVLVSVLLIVFSNLVIPYLFFVAVHLITELWLVGWGFFDNVTSVGTYRLASIELYWRLNRLFGDSRGILTGNLKL